MVPASYLATVELSSAVTVAANERRRLIGDPAEAGLDDPATWLAGAAVEIEGGLGGPGDGGLSAREITARVPR